MSYPLISQGVLFWLSHLMSIDLPRIYGRELMQIADKGVRSGINHLAREDYRRGIHQGLEGARGLLPNPSSLRTRGKDKILPELKEKASSR
jgi:hypothetical protein